jgi:hypothetical protein
MFYSKFSFLYNHPDPRNRYQEHKSTTDGVYSRIRHGSWCQPANVMKAMNENWIRPRTRRLGGRPASDHRSWT